MVVGDIVEPRIATDYTPTISRITELSQCSAVDGARTQFSLNPDPSGPLNEMARADNTSHFTGMRQSRYRTYYGMLYRERLQ